MAPPCVADLVAHSWAFCLPAPAEPALIWPVSGRPRPGGGEVLGQRRAAGAGRPVCGFVFLKHGLDHARRAAAGDLGTTSMAKASQNRHPPHQTPRHHPQIPACSSSQPPASFPSLAHTAGKPHVQRELVCDEHMISSPVRRRLRQGRRSCPPGQTSGPSAPAGVPQALLRHPPMARPCRGVPPDARR